MFPASTSLSLGDVASSALNSVLLAQYCVATNENNVDACFEVVKSPDESGGYVIDTFIQLGGQCQTVDYIEYPMHYIHQMGVWIVSTTPVRHLRLADTVFRRFGGCVVYCNQKNDWVHTGILCDLWFTPLLELPEVPPMSSDLHSTDFVDVSD